jgi:hypothetical protein
MSGGYAALSKGQYQCGKSADLYKEAANELWLLEL